MNVGHWIGNQPHSLPEIRDRVALQSQHEPENNADDRCHENYCVEDELVHSVDGEAEEGHGDSQSCDCDYPDVAALAEPPPLIEKGLSVQCAEMRKIVMSTYKHRCLSSPSLKERHRLLPDSVQGACDAAQGEQDIQHLRGVVSSRIEL